MKMKLWVLSVIVILAGTSCQEKFDLEMEKEAIIAVIQDEKDGFTNMDPEQWSRNVLQDPSYTWMASSSEEYWLSEGYSEQLEWNKEMWSTWDPDEIRDKIEFEVTEIKVTPQAAWAFIKVDGRVEALFLEKVDNSWVISFQAILVTSSYDADEVSEVSEDIGEEAAEPDAE